nr:fibrinogen alpha chain-like [Salvelinus alpinus]
MQRLEVDIDIKLRTCKGSCKGYVEFSVDKESYVALDKQMDQLESQSVQSVETVRTLYVMKSRPLKDVVVDSKYKSGPAEEQKEVFFPEVKTVKLTLETQESDASSAAKVPVCSLWMQQGTGVTQSVRQRDRGRRGWCPDRPEYPLCSDHQWESRCPSGCRLQGLMEQTERQTAGRLRDICERTQRYEDAATSSMVTTKHIYNSNRKAIVKTHMSELRYVEFAEGLAMNLTSLRKGRLRCFGN